MIEEDSNEGDKIIRQNYIIQHSQTQKYMHSVLAHYNITLYMRSLRHVPVQLNHYQAMYKAIKHNSSCFIAMYIV
jgi:hypothetical protein